MIMDKTTCKTITKVSKSLSYKINNNKVWELHFPNGDSEWEVQPLALSNSLFIKGFSLS